MTMVQSAMRLLFIVQEYRFLRDMDTYTDTQRDINMFFYNVSKGVFRGK